MNLTQVIYRVIDTETTGLAPPAAAICEVAFRDMRYDGRALGDFQTLCNPGHPIPPGAQAIHHISDEDVADKPKWIDVRPHCLAGISKTEMVYVAHNAPFDRAFLCIDGAWLDTLKIAKHLWPESGHKNDELRYFLKLKPDLVKDSPSHRAMNDVAVTAAILIHAFSVIAERHPEIETVEQLVKWSERPCLLLRVPFKNKGSPLFTEADLGLLQWIISRNAGGEDVIYSAKHELKRRAGTPQ